jgi:hypothetical protein
MNPVLQATQLDMPEEAANVPELHSAHVVAVWLLA